MKKLILIVLIIVGSACSSEDDSTVAETALDSNALLEFLPITHVNLPNAFKVGETQTLQFLYYLPSECHTYQGVYYDKDNTTHTFAIISSVNGNCERNLNTLQTAEFNFTPEIQGTHIFKILRGDATQNSADDLNNDAEYQQITITVSN